MRLRKMTAAFGAILLLSASGCNFTELSFENSLRPPKTMGDEAEIEQLISQAANGSYTLKYPKSGNYRSAVIMQDLDGDDIDEAIAFFRGKDELTSVHLLVMNEVDGEWSISGDFINETTDVDCVDFADIDDKDGFEILVGYTTYTPNVNFLSCYSFRDGKTDTIRSGQNYSAFYCGNIDNNGKSEVVALSLFNVDTEAKATMLEYSESKKALYAKASVAMDPNVVKYKSAILSDFADGVKGMIIDGASASEELSTQVIYYNTELAVLRNPLYRDKTKNVTQRASSVMSTDIDNDLNIEIPVVEKLPYSGADDSQTVADKLTWYTFDPKSEAMTPKVSMAANYNFGYTIKLPEKWDGSKVTAMNDSEDTMVFSTWENKEIGQRLFEIKVFDVTLWDQGKNNDEYTLIYRDNRHAYTFQNFESNSELALTDDEIKTAFAVLSDTNI